MTLPRLNFLRFLLLGLIMFLLYACSPTTISVTPLVSIPSKIQTALPEPTALTIPTRQPTRGSIYIIDVPVNYLTYKQTVLKDSQESIQQWQRIEAWLSYWIKCDNRPLDPAAEMHWELLYDNPNDPTESFMVISTNGAYYSTPVLNGKWLDPPSNICLVEPDPLFTPLLLATGEDRQWLRVESGIPVQYDAQGNRVAEIDLRGGQKPDINATQELAEIVIEKLNHFPESYQYLTAHPDEFQNAPDPLTDIIIFNSWWNDRLVPVLGELENRAVNYTTVTYETRADWDHLDFNTGYGAANPIVGSKFFFFSHNGIIYPVPVFSVGYPGEQTPFITTAVILFNGFGAPEGTGVIESIAQGALIRHVSIYRDQNTPSESIVQMLLTIGINGAFRDDNQVVIGVGRMLTSGNQ